MTIIKSISVSPEFDKLAKDYHLSWTEASRIGVAVMLGDLGIKEYDNKLNLVRKMTLFRQELERVSSEFEEFKKKHGN